MADRDGGPDWIDRLTRLGGMVGMNQVRLRWKLMAWRDSWRDSLDRGRGRVEHVRYQHKSCPACGNLEDRDSRTCGRCGAGLETRLGGMVRRAGLLAPDFITVSALLTLVMLAAYARMVLAQGGGGFFSFEAGTLYRFGAHHPPSVWQGQWWRLSTAIFLHIGLWHIAFNLIALQQVGPAIERIFGRGRMLFFFMVTGIAANIGSELFGLRGLSAGASGSLMGLIGLAAGWGHRDGTTQGREIRNQMVKWGLYTMVFGIYIRADNAAHGVGFISGALLGLVARPRGLEGKPPLLLETWVGLGLFLGTAFLVLFPPG